MKGKIGHRCSSNQSKIGIKIMKVVKIILLIFVASIEIGCQNNNAITSQANDVTMEKTILKKEHNGTFFRDLNKNGVLDIYENINQPIGARIEDLLSQMTLGEKAGMLFIDGVRVNEDGSLQSKSGPGFGNLAVDLINNQKMSHFNIWQIPANPAIFAKWYNNLQQYAEETRLGIPITIASDPRHHFSNQIFAMRAEGFSQFCEPLGFAAIGDTALVREFADIVRQEYLAVGIREALHPQVDLATEPRWPRINGGFGEDARLTAEIAKAYIQGLQGTELNDRSVACMTKHFPGGGPQNEGLDPHFAFHKGQIYPGDNFDYHLIPFEAAIESKTAAIMPYYGVPVGQTDEEVAMSFNKAIITDLLRNKYQYEGVVCTDWGLITDTNMGNVVWPARAWGVEHLSAADRVKKALNAGVDQFGGEKRPELIVRLVEDGKLDEQRVDVSVRRLLRQKFQLGLFDRPFVDETKVNDIVGNDEFQKLGEATQQKAMTLLKNDGDLLPLPKQELKMYVENIDSATVAKYATVVQSPADADIAIIRLNTPWYPVETDNPFAKGFHHGDLDFKGAAKTKIMDLLTTVPTIVNLYLDRPAVIPDIAAKSKALIVDYGASDRSVCEVLFGNAKPEGKLPFELPSSMNAVRNQKPDVPHDSKNPLFEFGFGLRYQ